MTVYMSNNIRELRGIGLECLLDKDGNVLFKFVDGYLVYAN